MSLERDSGLSDLERDSGLHGSALRWLRILRSLVGSSAADCKSHRVCVCVYSGRRRVQCIASRVHWLVGLWGLGAVGSGTCHREPLPENILPEIWNLEPGFVNRWSSLFLCLFVYL